MASPNDVGTKKIKQISRENEFEEQLMSRTPTRVLYPEQLSFLEQIACLSAAAAVSGCEGSAFHSLIFASGARTSLMLCPRPANLNFFLCDELIDGDAIYVKCARSADDMAAAAHQRSWTLDVEKAFRAITAAM